MHELVRADGEACKHCAANTFSIEGNVCVSWRLGQANKKNGKNRRIVIGRNQSSGTTLRPDNCPHPDDTVATTPNAQVMIRKLLGR